MGGVVPHNVLITLELVLFPIEQDFDYKYRMSIKQPIKTMHEAFTLEHKKHKSLAFYLCKVFLKPNIIMAIQIRLRQVFKIHLN